ncbi:antibiotic biosynthesis monooxygenase [Sandaracinobacter sp. RS1-74]|uniref:antibiotic biosynthesis monooxygenase family protein n=1 Tax=Sandaracinobacteroides sayramensis TaxID=2913411 RepID=UPI001EDA319F|nr:antibiotic biosynthesis monooxygenase [Sandaracinobacteroides sayramensis]MCG2842700.1 antibiotic biosynthesis monooxygenase [Sandaracinobacteroides sayramensis]
MIVAVYWWRVHPGKEEQFRAAWRRGTELITARYGSFGSRLHRAEDGRFVATAEWPDKASWQAAADVKMVYDEPETRQAFVDAVAEGGVDHVMEVTDDLLLRAGREALD